MSPEPRWCTAPFDDGLFRALLVLNNANAEELSYTSEADFRALLKAARLVRAEAHGRALIVVFDETCTYDNPNFAWFKARHARFLYIDRVVVNQKARGLGLARALYEQVEQLAATEGHGRVVCEINKVPPNEQSDEFHRRMGFSVVGEQALPDRGKVVRFWMKNVPLTPSQSD